MKGYTMTNTKTYGYSVVYGPTTRHLNNTKIFKLLRDAKSFVLTLSNSAYKLERLIDDGKPMGFAYSGALIDSNQV